MNDINISRRNFLLSSGALVAGSLLPKMVFAVSVPDDIPFRKNEITEVLLSSSRKVPSEEFKIPFGRGEKVIEWNKVGKALIGSVNDVQKPADSFLKEMPLLGLSQLGEMMLLKILPLFGSIGGPVVGLVLSSLFSFLNGLFSPNSGPSLQDEIKRIAGEMIDSNNYELMRLSTKGIHDVYSDFITHLDLYLKQQHRDDSRDQVLNKFDALVAVATKELPTLRELSDGIGLPLYMQVASVIINAYREMLSRKRELNLDDKYYNTNLEMLRKKSSSWLSEANNTIRKKFDEKKHSFSEASDYLRDIYTGGYAMLLAAYKTSFCLEVGVNLDVRNTAELYTGNGPSGREWESVTALINKDIIKRKSLLSTLEMVGHKDNILRICQEYYDGDGKIHKIEGQSCSNWQGNSNAYLVKRDFKINQFRDSNITGDFLPNSFIANTPNQGTYLIELDSPAGIIRAGSGNTNGLYNLNVPGYFFSGVAFSTKDRGTCAQDAGWGLFTHSGIFRHYDGIMVRTEIDVDDAGNPIGSSSYEFDLNNSAIWPEPRFSAGYSDILLGKNIITNTGKFNALFRLYTKNEKLRLSKEITYKVFLLVSEKSIIDEISLVPMVGGPDMDYDIARLKDVILPKPLYTIESLAGEKFGLYELQFTFNPEGFRTYAGMSLSITMEGHFASATLVLDMPPLLRNGDFSEGLAHWDSSPGIGSISIKTDEVGRPFISIIPEATLDPV